jgi:hypothetical protein
LSFDNKTWQAELRSSLSALKACQFPKSSEIVLGGTRELATITMKEKGLLANMQSDAAAFEGWALALLCHCQVQRVQIDIDPAAKQDGPHYQRFLYRLKRFADLFPDRVISAFLPEPKALTKGKRVWNQSNDRLEAPETRSRERMLAASRDGRSESDLELALEVSKAFKARFQLDKVMRQWPVGLFDGRVTSGNRIFTGGKSGIDLIGIRAGTLVLFELKKRGNEKVGAVSELFFYASVMRDSIGASAIFEFKFQKAQKNCAIAPEDIVSCSRISAVLLAPRFHPLIAGPRIFECLNQATNKPSLDRPIRFETATLDYPEDESGDFTFSQDPFLAA